MKNLKDVLTTALMWTFLLLIAIILITMGFKSLSEMLIWIVHIVTDKTYTDERFVFASLAILGFIYYFIHSANRKYGWYLALHPKAKRIAKRARSLVQCGDDFAFYLSFGEYIRVRPNEIPGIDCQSDKDMLLTILKYSYDNLLLSGFNGANTHGYLYRNSFFDIFRKTCEKLKGLGIIVSQDSALDEINKSINFAEQVHQDPVFEVHKRPVGTEAFFAPKKRINQWYLLRIGLILALVSCLVVPTSLEIYRENREGSETKRFMDSSEISESSTVSFSHAADDISMYWGSKKSDIIHKASCRHAKKISKENRVYYRSVEEAEKVGRTPCSVCLGE